MIAEIAAIGIVAGVGFTVIDHENLFGNNPQKQFWWERVQWPWVAQPPAAGARINRAIQTQPSLSPEGQLQQARMGVVYADQMLNNVSKKYPSLAVQSKYELSSRPQQQQFIEPYRPKTYP